MRLWHQKLIPYLDRQRLLGQHRECAALRGAGWGRKHSTVDYVFKYDPIWLDVYHWFVMEEMIKRGYHPDPIWNNPNYRGKTLGEQPGWANLSLLINYPKDEMIYKEHDDKYLQECLDILANKGVVINMEEDNGHE